MLKYLNAGEQPNPKVILARMMEDGKCLLSGNKLDLTYVPVDTDTSNILPTNMACVTVDIAKDILYTSYYEIAVPQFSETDPTNFLVTLDTPPQFEEYNRQILASIKLSACARTPAQALLDAFERLAELHVKGVFKISLGNVTLDRMQYQGFLLRSLVRVQQNKPHIHLA